MLWLTAAHADEVPTTASGEVRVPLAQYQELLSQLSAADQVRPAPARYAYSKMSVQVNANDQDGRVTATVTIQATLRTLESEWTLVPLLPAGIAVSRAEIDGATIALVAAPEGLAWAAESAGEYSLLLVYQVDASRRGAAMCRLVCRPGPAANSTRPCPAAASTPR